jgi:5-methylcytosine-specific restriction endonuclease McrA
MAQSTCSVESCERPSNVKKYTLCQAHYSRLWMHGDVQADVPIAPPRKPSRPPVDFDDGTRQCQTCDQRLPLSSFHADKRSPLGRRADCRVCRTDVEKIRHAENAESVRVRVTEYRKANAEKVRAADMRRYERDREKRIALATANAHVRRARMANRTYDVGVTVPALRKRDGERCHYCHTPLVFGSYPRGTRPSNMGTLEHKVAIARGGAHTWDNCVLACWRCNSSKGARDYPTLEANSEAQQPPSITTTPTSGPI